MRRRSALRVAASVTLGVAMPTLVQAQRHYRIGMLSLAALPSRLVTTDLLRPLGYEEGRNLTVDARSAEGQPQRLPALAAELMAARPDLVLGPTNTEVETLKRASATVPIVMMFVTAPVETGLVASMARPGGNLTGTTTNTPEMAGRMTQLLRDAVPGLSRIVWLADLDYPGMRLYVRHTDAAAVQLAIKVENWSVRTVPELDDAMARLEHDKPSALGIAMTGALAANAARIVAFAARHRLPALYSARGPVLQGGLMSYTADFDAIRRRHVSMVDRILKGARPADIPVEEPAKFLLSINLKTAKAMGLVIPAYLIALADEVIE